MSGLTSGLVLLVKWLPVVFVLGVTVWSYYAYSVHFVLNTLDNIVERVLLTLLYHIFLCLYLWSYGKVVLTHPGRVPQRFRMNALELEELETLDLASRRRRLEVLLAHKDLHVATVSLQREIRFCADCSQIKPDRCHHCSICSTCILKMDHHCPWVNNCIGFANYKFFVLFLLHALLYCLYIAFSTFSHFLSFWADANSFDIDANPTSSTAKFHVLFMFFVSAMFSVSLASLFGYHCYLSSCNVTTIEAIRYPVLRSSGVSDKGAFHLGVWANIQEVFGDRLLLYFFPVSSTFGDGITFPLRHCGDEESGLLDVHKNHNNRVRASAEDCDAEERTPMMNMGSHMERSEDSCTSSSVSNSSQMSADINDQRGGRNERGTMRM